MATNSVTDSDITSIDPETIGPILEMRYMFIEEAVRVYTKSFDKCFAEIVETLTSKGDKTLNKFLEIREKHLKVYEKYIEKSVDQRIRQLFEDKTIASKLVYISENFDKFPVDFIKVQSAIDPFKQEFIESLKSFEQSVDERLESKNQLLAELTENLTKAEESFESIRKSVQKVFKIQIKPC